MEYKTYYDNEAGWAWLARDKETKRVLVISTGHPSEFSANTNLESFKRTQ